MAGAIGQSDPYIANVVSLLNFQGSDGSTVFTDGAGKSWTVGSATAEIDTSLGYNAGYFNGAGRLECPTHVDWAMGTGDFTIEAWINPSAVSGDRSIFGVNVSGGVSFGLNAGKVFCGPTGVSYGVLSTSVVPVSALTHVAACKELGTMRIFVNGALENSGSDSRNYMQAKAMIASNQIPPASPVAPFQGWMRGVRITKGVARYTSSFTPAMAPFPTT